VRSGHVGHEREKSDLRNHIEKKWQVANQSDLEKRCDGLEGLECVSRLGTRLEMRTRTVQHESIGRGGKLTVFNGYMSNSLCISARFANTCGYLDKRVVEYAKLPQMDLSVQGQDDAAAGVGARFLHGRIVREKRAMVTIVGQVVGSW
jgi:hypothetical protein